MATVRRRVGRWLSDESFSEMRDAVIELAMVLFGYDAQGRITGVEAIYDELEDPGQAVAAGRCHSLRSIGGTRLTACRRRHHNSAPDDECAAQITHAEPGSAIVRVVIG